MKFLDLTLASPEQNLALDEALLDECDEGHSQEVLRFWESPVYFACLGYSNKILKELDAEACRARKIPIFRRCSGGGTVLQGPGCLNYSLIMRIDGKRPINSIQDTYGYVLNNNREAVDRLLKIPSSFRGISDLTVNEKKFSGNAQRRKKNALLFHGTFLIDFDISLIEKTLRFPSREPDYRKGRAHGDFLTVLNLDRLRLKESLKNQWASSAALKNIPQKQLDKLITARYSLLEWHQKY